MGLIFDGRQIFANELNDDIAWTDEDLDGDELDSEIIWDNELDSYRD